VKSSCKLHAISLLDLNELFSDSLSAVEKWESY